MSGGSMDYLYAKVEDALFVTNTPERRAFYKHLKLVAKALRAIEWNDSCDGDDTEHDAIMACIKRADVLQEAIEQAEKARAELSALLNMPYAALGQPESEGKCE